MRASIENLPSSRIREVANAGMARGDVLAFWFGESDEPTPAFVRDAAAESLARGDTGAAASLSPTQSARTSARPGPPLATSRMRGAGRSAIT